MLRNWHTNINRLRQIPESKGKKEKQNKETDKQTKKIKEITSKHPKIKLEEVFSIYTASMV